MIGRTVGPYRVLSLLGSGGMGDVFLAEDPRLERKVALKCPSDAWLTQPDARERLQREARAVARLKHPNIAAIYDVLDVGDRPFIVMEYVEGESLGQAMRRGRLSLGQAVQIAIQITEAVAEAHANGVLHRDLKPGNIRLMPDGKAKVLDFGLAHVRPTHLDVSTPPSRDSTLTAAGQRLGTPGYASPEQLSGKPVDQRSDLYSIGVILFEMITGQLPFAGEDPMGLTLATVTERIPPVQTINPEAPQDLAAAVAHAVEKDPAKRPQSAMHYAAELRRVAAGLAERPTGMLPETGALARPRVTPATVRWSPRLLLGSLVAVLTIAGIVTTMRWATTRAGSAAVRSPVVAVLPCTVTGDDHTLNAVAVGLADTLTSDLAKLPGVVVVPRSATLAFVGPTALTQVAEQQGTSHVVQCAVSNAGTNVTLDVSLQASDGRTVWQRQYRSSRDRVVEMEPRLRQDLATVLVGALNVPRTIETGGTLDAQAFERYAEARTLLDRRDIPENVTRAIELFRSAINQDPGYTLAYLGLSEAYWVQYTLKKDRDLSDQAKDALIKAQTLQPDLPQLQYQLAVFYNNTGHAGDALAALQRAVTYNPNDADAYLLFGRILFDQGNIEAGLAAFAKAVEIRPNHVRGHLTLATAAQMKGRFDEAEVAYRRVTELAPESPTAYAGLAAIYHARKQFAEAEENYVTAIRLGATPSTRVNFGQFYYETGRYADAVDVLEGLVKDVPGHDLYWRVLGDAYRELGRQDRAREAYGQAVTAGEQALKVNPQDPATLSSVAISEARLGGTGRAREHMQRAVDLSPKSGNVLYRACVTSLVLGDTALALTYLRRAVSEGYPAQRAAEDRDLAPLRQTAEFTAIVSSGTRPPAGPH